MNNEYDLMIISRKNKYPVRFIVFTCLFNLITPKYSENSTTNVRTNWFFMHIFLSKVRCSIFFQGHMKWVSRVGICSPSGFGKETNSM